MHTPGRKEKGEQAQKALLEINVPELKKVPLRRGGREGTHQRNHRPCTAPQKNGEVL